MSHRTELSNGDRLIAIEDIEPELAALVQEKHKARNKAARTGHPEDIARFNHMRRVASKAIRKAKREAWRGRLLA